MKLLLAVCVFASVGCSTMNSYLKEKEQPLIVDEVGTGEFVSKFVPEVCGFKPEDADKVPKAKREDCDKKYYSMILARWNERYIHANPDILKDKCEAYPQDCKNTRQQELWVKESHEVNKKFVSEKQTEYDRAVSAEKWRRVGESLSNSSKNLQPKSGTNCVTSPNAFGGQNIQCN